MATAEAIFLSVASSISKAIARVWLGDTGIVWDVAEPVVEILSKKFGLNVLEKAKLNGFFDRIAQAVAENISEHIDAEFRSLDADQKRLAIESVARVISSHQIEFDAVFEASFDPAELATMIIEANPEVFGTLETEFTLPQQSLARCVLRASCDMIVTSLKTIPDFELEGMKFLIQTTNRLEASVETLKAEFSRISGSAFEEQHASDTFEERYRANVEMQFSRLRIFGVPTTRTGFQHYDLDTAYIQLETETSQSSEFVEVAKALANGRLHLIIGEAGSGKTTILQWMTVRSAQATFPTELGRLNLQLPFFIRLRQYANENLPTPSEFISGTSQALSDLQPSRWAQSQLDYGAVVLIDGLDEFPTHRTTEFYTWLEDLIVTFPDSTFCLSSRPSAVDPQHFREIGFNIFYLREMSLAQTNQLIDKWHKAMLELFHSDSKVKQLTKNLTSVKSQIETRSTIRELASSPLLCAMICTISLDHDGNIPDDRTEVYSTVVDALLEAREKQRGIKDRVWSAIRLAEKKSILGEIAYIVQVNSGGPSVEIDLITLRSGMSDVLRKYPGVMKALGDDDYVQAAASCIDLLVSRSGILRSPAAGKIDFIHKSFLEYFCALSALSKNFVPQIVNNCLDPSWREVIVFASALANIDQKTAICALLTQRLTSSDHAGGPADDQLEESDDRLQIKLVIANCLKDLSIGVDQEQRELLNGEVASVIPPKSQQAARSLSGAGPWILDPLIDYAAEHPESEFLRFVLFCIRSVDHGHQVFRQFSNRTEINTVSEVIHALPFWEMEIFKSNFFVEDRALTVRGDEDRGLVIGRSSETPSYLNLIPRSPHLSYFDRV